MQTLSSLKTLFQKGAKDTSSATWDDFGLLNVNTGLHVLEAELGIVEQEKVRQVDTTASTTTVELPEDLIRLKKIYLTVDNRRVTPDPVFDDDIWQDLLTYDTNEQSNYAEKYIIRGNYIELFPEPVDSKPLTFIYQGTSGDLLYENNTTGTISVTNGSTTFTGSGTSWDSSYVGRFIKPLNSRHYYQIASITNSTSGAFRKKYQGATASGTTHITADIPYSLPDSAQHLPAIYALWQYYTFIRKDTTLAGMYKNQYETQRDTTKGIFKMRNQSVVIPSQNKLRLVAGSARRSIFTRGLTSNS